MSEHDAARRQILYGLLALQNGFLSIEDLVAALAAWSAEKTRPMREWLGQGMFFIAPLLAGKREIGVIYADCRLSGRALRHEQFVAFQHFAQAAGRCLEAMAQRS